MADYGSIWRTQPQVRKVVGFLARSIAELNLTLYRRVSDTDRKRVDDHALARAIRHPSGWETSAKMSKTLFFETLVSDRCIFDNAYWLKMRAGDEMRLVPLPPTKVTPYGDDWLAPTSYTFASPKGPFTLRADQVVHFRGYNPADRRVGFSPIETLRQILLEDMESDRYREQLWRRGARMSGVIERPADAPEWSDPARARFMANWRAQWADDGPEAGGTPILEDGMMWKQASFSARDAQWLEAKKLTREEVAAAFHVPQPMVGILDRATFSNVADLHKSVYQDTLPPWCVGIEEDIELQLIPEWRDLVDSNAYVEFNLNAKLRGDLIERVRALQSATGAPWLTRNEARALDNRSPKPGGDELITPLNVLVGGQASPTDSAPEAGQASAEVVETVGRFLVRCGRTCRGRWREVAEGDRDVGSVWQPERWSRELSDDLERVGVDEPDVVAAGVLLRTRAGVLDALAAPDPDHALAQFFAAAEADRTIRQMIEEET